MQFQVLVLSTDRSQRETWAATLKNSGLRTRIAGAWPEARQSMFSHTTDVVLFDADEPVAPTADVLSASNEAGVPVIILARDFDTVQWMYLLKNGAVDVLRHSAEPAYLRESVEAAIHKSKISPRKVSWARSLLEWTRSKFARRAPADIVE